MPRCACARTTRPRRRRPKEARMNLRTFLIGRRCGTENARIIIFNFLIFRASHSRARARRVSEQGSLGHVGPDAGDAGLSARFSIEIRGSNSNPDSPCDVPNAIIHAAKAGRRPPPTARVCRRSRHGHSRERRRRDSQRRVHGRMEILHSLCHSRHARRVAHALIHVRHAPIDYSRHASGSQGAKNRSK